MKQFINRLHELVGLNKTEQALKSLLEMFGRYERSAYQTPDDISDLKTQMVLLSARLTQTVQDEKAGLIKNEDAETSKNQIRAAFLSHINSFSDYPNLVAFLNENEEENAWADASVQNSIEGYQDYFQKYPNGKYKQETEKIIAELKAINAEKEKEIREKAVEEKQRRAKQMQNAEVIETPHNQEVVMQQAAPLNAQQTANIQPTNDVATYVIYAVITIAVAAISFALSATVLIYPAILLAVRFLSPTHKYAKYAMPLLKIWGVLVGCFIIFALVSQS